MKSPDEVLEQVLAALRDTEAPTGMERRILNAIQDHASAKPAPQWPWLRSVPPRTWGFALASIIAVCATISLMPRIERAPVQPKMQQPSAAPLLPAASGTVAKNTEPPSPTRSAHFRRKTRTRKAASIRDIDSVAWSEMRAPSRPEPPLPLTTQEKLLLQIVHKGNPVELAALDPAKRAEQNARDRAEVESFFGRSPGQSIGKPTRGDSE